MMMRRMVMMVMVITQGLDPNKTALLILELISSLLDLVRRKQRNNSNANASTRVIQRATITVTITITVSIDDHIQLLQQNSKK
jgi:hypothetical protein